MDRLFGYQVESALEIARKQRVDRIGWALVGTVAAWGVYEAMGGPHALEVFQAFFTTVLFYGDRLYVRRADGISKPRSRTVILATFPLHLLYLAAIVGLDGAFPANMKKGLVMFPILAVGFAIESILADKILGAIDRKSPPLQTKGTLSL